MSALGPLQLRIAQLVSDTEAEGPGRRFALWVQGCPIRCPGCCNPEMFESEGGELVDVDALAQRILATPAIEGISLLGGEPVSQAAAVASLAKMVRERGLSVMLYSGYSMHELKTMRDPAVDALLASCDLLVDGRYEKDRPETARRWIGSSNQELHFLTDRYSPSDPRFTAKNGVEIRIRNGEITVNGWPALAARLLPKKRLPVV